MEHADSRMMVRIAEIENAILGGFVLDDRGGWVSIADKRLMEENFLAHLDAGQVLHNGHWMTFAEVRQAPSHDYSGGVSAEEETSSHSLPQSAALPEFADEQALAPDQSPHETKIIQISPPLPQRAGTDVDPQSGYAPETGLFEVGQNGEADEPANLQK